eukprot:CAMPEP_0185291104 /NCGR_PEP_ID=MMETSP1363-20130426/5094_1 /TAXON_ID=38817 /ORGANISM="Gephyrocapsa oceanica, Strain RCC1303" /LENGTH=118 /DNA_ID=CAMNT_0027887183 /DNA_START=28 /DNA_END=385 /DNA_ORIENTATION=-
MTPIDTVLRLLGHLSTPPWPTRVDDVHGDANRDVHRHRPLEAINPVDEAAGGGLDGPTVVASVRVCAAVDLDLEGIHAILNVAIPHLEALNPVGEVEFNGAIPHLSPRNPVGEPHQTP